MPLYVFLTQDAAMNSEMSLKKDNQIYYFDIYKDSVTLKKKKATFPHI
jgi:hypothetical protein